MTPELTQSAPAVWAMPSINSTPGMTGISGKWPWNCGSLKVTFLIPTQLSSRTQLMMRSTSRKG